MNNIIPVTTDRKVFIMAVQMKHKDTIQRRSVYGEGKRSTGNRGFNDDWWMDDVVGDICSNHVIPHTVLEKHPILIVRYEERTTELFL